MLHCSFKWTLQMALMSYSAWLLYLSLWAINRIGPSVLLDCLAKKKMELFSVYINLLTRMTIKQILYIRIAVLSTTILLL